MIRDGCVIAACHALELGENGGELAHPTQNKEGARAEWSCLLHWATKKMDLLTPTRR